MSVQSAGQQGVLLLTRCSPAVTAVASCRFRPLRRRFSAWRGVHVSQEEDSWLASGPHLACSAVRLGIPCV